MDNQIEEHLLTIFMQSVSNNFEEVKASEEKISSLYNDSNKENYIKILLKFIMYPHNEKNEQKNFYDKFLNKNVKISILISIKNYIKKSIHSNLENVELSNDLCIIIKHICMHVLLDIKNEEIKSLEKYFFEILFNLFKYNICDDYDYLLFYIIILYINDYNIVHLINIFNNEEKKSNPDAMKIIECIMLYVRNKEILQNITQENFFIEYNKLIENIENIKGIINNRNNSLNDDIVNYINNTKKIYKSNNQHNLFMLNDHFLYNIEENTQINNSLTSNFTIDINKKNSLNSISGFDFVGKGTIIKDYNNNIKLLSVSKANVIFKNINISFFKNKHTALKIIRKILKKYKDNDYVSKYDLKIVLTHIEYPITLYFIYLYNKFTEYTNFINNKLSLSNSYSTTTNSTNTNEEINICFYIMNHLLMNIHIFLKIFYNIIIIDLPEYYEDNFDIFFNIFYNFLLFDMDILKNYFNHINLLKNMKTDVSSTSLSNKQNIFMNESEKNLFRITNEDLIKLKKNFEHNLLKCKIMITDIIKVISENYQEESKTYIIKLIFSLTQMLYKEEDKILICHNYNCLSSTIKLIHHMNLEKNDLNPYKDKEFLEKIIERVLYHIRLKRIDIDEINEADLDYFKNDLNNVNSFSIRSTAIYFLKTLCNNYFDICFPLLEFRILSKDSLIISSVNLSNLNNNNAINRNTENDLIIDKNDTFYDACNMEYKVQLITCLNQINLAQSFYEHNLKNVLKEFIMSIRMKFSNLDNFCYNINDYNFLNQNLNQTDKCVWLKNEEIFNSKNTIYLLSILKFLLNNRNICNVNTALDIFTFLNFLLYNEKIMIYSYSCLCINRLLNQNLSEELLNIIFNNTIPNILSRLLFLLKFHIYNKTLNEYILITILRIFLIYPEKLSSFYVSILLIIDNIIKLIVNDSHNPLFNHYLFELLTIIISLIYKSRISSSINQVENVIITTFAQILQLYIHDFIPYIFQILSIIIDNTDTIQKIHIKILNNLYEMDLWRSTIGNANGIICVLKSFFKKYNMFQDIIKNNMQQLFNIYHYCLSNKKLSTDSFQIILIIFTYLPVESYQSFLKPLFVLLFTFVQQYKNDIIKIKVIHSLSVFILKTDVNIFINTVEQIQNGLIFNVLKSLYMPILDKLINVNEKIIIFIALTKLISNEKIRNESFVVEMLNHLNKNITSNELVLKKSKSQYLDIEKDEMDKNFEVTYVKLQMINNENINETVLRDININAELKQNLFNPIFMQICHSNSYNSILQLFNN
ncbi:conserved Plasmodium protein, unknown function [Plasmodium relictum]|uniref:Exportin-2 C-terminal domain-containing protein n=1 Tax=Plasmodium relictum TaxID=85471 RepID=A0A1J1H3R0_PLARL|nr:conserved Plasmodium protein, unknown function [Plasmodium relictum]CRG99542.1 conserved Plasmodium protein, unknown function [Plasmodium relictum]